LLEDALAAGDTEKMFSVIGGAVSMSTTSTSSSSSADDSYNDAGGEDDAYDSADTDAVVELYSNIITSLSTAVNLQDSNSASLEQAALALATVTNAAVTVMETETETGDDTESGDGSGILDSGSTSITETTTTSLLDDDAQRATLDLCLSIAVDSLETEAAVSATTADAILSSLSKLIDAGVLSSTTTSDTGTTTVDDALEGGDDSPDVATTDDDNGTTHDEDASNVLSEAVNAIGRGQLFGSTPGETVTVVSGNLALFSKRHSYVALATDGATLEALVSVDDDDDDGSVTDDGRRSLQSVLRSSRSRRSRSSKRRLTSNSDDATVQVASVAVPAGVLDTDLSGDNVDTHIVTFVNNIWGETAGAATDGALVAVSRDSAILRMSFADADTGDEIAVSNASSGILITLPQFATSDIDTAVTFSPTSAPVEEITE
jgi:hypothetical protein